MNRTEKAAAFRRLHVPGEPLILFNVWDAGSARAVAEAGAKALATGSWSVAAAHGFGEKEDLPLDLVLANAARIAGATELPVSLDFEGGYARDAARLEANVRRLADTSVIGVNFEDGVVGEGGVYCLEEQRSRVGAIRRGDAELFINARTDLFLTSEADRHASLLDEAIERAHAYDTAGADGFFAPGLKDEALIGRLCKAVRLPVNIMVTPGVPEAAVLADLGVARISHGAGPYRAVMKTLTDKARAALGV